MIIRIHHEVMRFNSFKGDENRDKYNACKKFMIIPLSKNF
ncbi:unnamed protein product [marine sediment metagenome]|uniref:Uncharacterized protein n=1 Tax=marine sediment metagenome TaxID=412755 RepID=X1Q5Z6_9ZZZZ